MMNVKEEQLLVGCTKNSVLSAVGVAVVVVKDVDVVVVGIVVLSNVFEVDGMI